MRGKCRILAQKPRVDAVIFDGDVGRRLVIAGKQHLPLPRGGQQALEFPDHRLFPEFHAHLVEMPQKRHLRLFFDVIASSAEIGYAKPDKTIFENALKLANCTADESVMVGDRLDNDIIPAKALGMKTVWLKNGLAKYQSSELGEGFADYQISSLTELLQIL